VALAVQLPPQMLQFQRFDCSDNKTVDNFNRLYVYSVTAAADKTTADSASAAAADALGTEASSAYALERIKLTAAMETTVMAMYSRPTKARSHGCSLAVKSI
jgi:hypothetical protein